MVVTQTPEVHRKIEDLLRTLRNQRGVQINVAVKFLTVDDTVFWSLLALTGQTMARTRTFNATGVPGAPRYDAGIILVSFGVVMIM